MWITTAIEIPPPAKRTLLLHRPRRCARLQVRRPADRPKKAAAELEKAAAEPKGTEASADSVAGYLPRS